MTRFDPPNAVYPHGNSPLVTAVIVNFNSWPDVERLVAVLANSPELEAGLTEVVIVDNGSDGPVPRSLARPASGVRVILRSDNGGFAVGVNIGWKAARSPWLWLLNPDVAAPEGLFGRVVAMARRFEDDVQDAPGVVGFGLLNPDGTRQPSVGTFPNLARSVWEQLIPRSRRKYQAVSRMRPGPVDWVTGACVMVNGRLLEALGGLDEAFFLYYEEVALCRSARRLGWRVEFDPSIEVTHLRPLQNRPLPPRLRVITRHSKLLYFRKHLPRWQFIALCGIVALEARASGAWALARGKTEEARASRAIVRIETALRRGEDLGGRDVLALAEAIAGSPPSRENAADKPAETTASRRGA